MCENHMISRHWFAEPFREKKKKLYTGLRLLRKPVEEKDGSRKIASTCDFGRQTRRGRSSAPFIALTVLSGCSSGSVKRQNCMACN